MLKIKKSDEVVVIAGRDKGRRGEVLRVMKDGRLMVAGINMVKKHKRPNPNAGEQGGIVEQEAPIQVSNVAIWNHEDERADRVGLRVEDGKKVRFFKSNGKILAVQIHFKARGDGDWIICYARHKKPLKNRAQDFAAHTMSTRCFICHNTFVSTHNSNT